jgi:uncharacterized phiE125 gp8 family phage protein
LRINNDLEDDQIDWLIVSAYDRVSNEIHRAVAIVAAEQSIDTFTSTKLLYGPVISIDEITYLDSEGDAQVLSDELYRYNEVLNMVIFDNVEIEATEIKIKYTCGYEDLPGPLRSAVLIYLADLYEVRQSIFVFNGRGDVILSDLVYKMIHPYVYYES